jgi:hypothetical protein
MTMDGHYDHYDLVAKANTYYYGAVVLQEGIYGAAILQARTFHLSNSLKFVDGAHKPAR